MSRSGLRLRLSGHQNWLDFGSPAATAGLDVAVRAITLTPAELLGVADRVGSIEPRKLADLVITSAPLGSSDARVLRVLSSGVSLKE